MSLIKRGEGYTFFEEADVVGVPYEHWPKLATGGIYDSLETAEREARATVPWLASSPKPGRGAR